MKKLEDYFRIIMISIEGIALTPELHLKWEDTNLPTKHFSIRPSIRFPWKVRLIRYNATSQHLVIEVVDYYPLEVDGFNLQQIKRPVKSLAFEKLDWRYFAAFLSTYLKSALMPFINDAEEIYSPDLSQRVYQYQLRVYFKDVRFILGGLRFWTTLPALNEPVELEIANAHIIPEFEFIKSYFSKALGKKSFDVTVKLTLIGDLIKQLDVRSKQIETIDEKMVTTLKNTRILGLQKAPKVIAVDKHLFNADEIFSEYYDEPNANLFQQNPFDIIKNLADLGVVRNRKQLEYLAGRKQLADQRILITLAPHLGFLFITSGNQKNHFIWELIDSHATYVWSFFGSPKSIASQLKKVEEIIGIIREQGREKYKNHYQNDLAHLVYEFTSVVHRHADRGIVDPFPNWKHRLESLLQ